MFAGFGASLSHFGRQQRGIGADQRADAFAFLRNDGAARQQLECSHGRFGRKQRVEQFARAQHSRAQLAQAKHHSDRNAVFFDMDINAVDGLPAGIELAPVVGDNRLQRSLITPGPKKNTAQLLRITGQRMKGPHMGAGPVHAQPQLRRKAGGPDLRRAVINGVHQAVLPTPDIAPRIGRQQRLELLDLRLLQCADPLGIKTRRHHQCEQFRRIAGFGRAGKQLAAQALAQFADKGGARRKAEVSQ